MFGIDEGALLLCGGIWLSGLSTAAVAMTDERTAGAVGLGEREGRGWEKKVVDSVVVCKLYVYICSGDGDDRACCCWRALSEVVGYVTFLR